AGPRRAGGGKTPAGWRRGGGGGGGGGGGSAYPSEARGEAHLPPEREAPLAGAGVGGVIPAAHDQGHLETHGPVQVPDAVARHEAEPTVVQRGVPSARRRQLGRAHV